MKDSIRGYLMILTATLFYGLYGVFNRLVGDFFTIISQAYVRHILLVIITSLYFFITKAKWQQLKKRDWRWLGLWILIDVLVTFLLFTVFNNLALGTSYFLFYSTMIISGLIWGAFLFQEKMNLIKIVAMTLAFIGLGITYKVEVSTETVRYILMALMAGGLIGLGNVIPKKISKEVPPMQLLFYDAIAIVVVSIAWAISAKESPPLLRLNWGWLWIVLFAFLNTLVTWLFITGIKRVEVQLATIIMPVETIFATIFGYIFFKEMLSIKTMIGGLFILTAALLPGIVKVSRRFRRSKDKRLEPRPWA